MIARRTFIGRLLAAGGLLGWVDRIASKPSIEVSNGFRRLSLAEREKLLQRGIRSYYVAGKDGELVVMTHEVKAAPGKLSKDAFPDFSYPRDWDGTLPLAYDKMAMGGALYVIPKEESLGKIPELVD